MAYNGVVFAGSLADINTAAAQALSIIQPMVAQLDFALFGSVGLGALQSNLQSQLSAALQAQLSIGLGILNPLAGFQNALAAIEMLKAQIASALAGAIPAISLEATMQISTLASFAAVTGVQVGALEALIQGGIAVKGPALAYAGNLLDLLGVGPIFVLSFEGIPLSMAGGGIAGDFGSGLFHGMSSIFPGETAYGVVLVTKGAAAWAALQATLGAI